MDVFILRFLLVVFFAVPLQNSFASTKDEFDTLKSSGMVVNLKQKFEDITQENVRLKKIINDFIQNPLILVSTKIKFLIQQDSENDIDLAKKNDELRDKKEFTFIVKTKQSQSQIEEIFDLFGISYTAEQYSTSGQYMKKYVINKNILNKEYEETDALLKLIDDNKYQQNLEKKGDKMMGQNSFIEDPSVLYNKGLESLCTDGEEGKAKDFFYQAALKEHCLAQAEYAKFCKGEEWLKWILKAAYNESYEEIEFLKQVNPSIMEKGDSEKALKWILENKDEKSFKESGSISLKTFFRKLSSEK